MNTRHVSATLFGLTLACLIAPAAVSAQTESWTSIGPEGGTAFALAIDPETASTIYAGTTGGVFKSTDAGVRWSPTNAGLPGPTNFIENGGPYVHALAIDLQNSATVYAGISFRDFFSEPSGPLDDAR
jgi:hypothetical protein